MIKKPYVKHERVRVRIEGPSRTKQSFQDDSDINLIMAKYVKTGVIEHMREHAGQFIDLPDPMDYQEALNITIAAENAFEGLPGNIRGRFDNDAVEFLAFMDDPDTIQEQVELGLREEMPELPVQPPLDPMILDQEPEAPAE